MNEKDYMPIYCFLFVLFVAITAVVCFTFSRNMDELEQSNRVIEQYRTELAECRGINSDLAAELDDCRKRLEATQSDLQRTTDRLSESNKRLANIGAIISGSAGTAGEAAGIISDARADIRRIIDTLEAIRAEIED